MKALALMAALSFFGCDALAPDATGCCKQSTSQCASPITKDQCDALDPPGKWQDGKECDLAGDCV